MDFSGPILDTRIALVVLLVCTSVHPKYIPGKVDSTTSTTAHPIDCFSPDASLDQLKAVGERKVSCKDNTKRFWVSACNCVMHPDAQCPKCRYTRNADELMSNGYRSTITSTYDEHDSGYKKLRAVQNHTSIGNSANFIRFGK